MDRSLSFPPLTPGMVALCAGRSWRSLLKMQALVAGMVSAAALLVFATQVRPVLWSAIENLPQGATISAGALHWPGETPVMLGQNETLSIAVSTEGASIPSLSDFQVALLAREVRFTSFFGHVSAGYWPSYRVELGRSQVEPLYGAWEAPACVILSVLVAAVLLLSWHLLGLLHGVAVLGLAWMLAKPLPYGRAYKVGLGTLFPGAALMFAGMFAYGLGQLSLTRLGILWALHLALGWVYLLLAIPKIPRDLIQNPFTAQAA